MSTPYKQLALLCVALLLGALVGYSRADSPLSQEGESLSPVIYPRSNKVIRFSHALHVGKLGARCQDCHAQVASSRSSLDNNLPREAQCRSCHAIDRSLAERPTEAGQAPTSCITCHTGFDAQTGYVPRAQAPIPNLKFSHSAHLARSTPCATCHGDPAQEQQKASQGAWLPTMRACLECHDDKQADASCTTCHISEAGGIVKTEFPQLGKLLPSGSLRGAAHDMNFRNSHKYAAQNDEQFCSTCHTKDDCVDCHSGVIKPMDFHGGDYISMHTIDARRNSPDCSSCHRIQTFCQGCHTRMGVAADGKGSEFGPMPGFNFHPPGWTSTSLTGDPGPASHAFEAQRNIKQCASCHRESFCTRCHSNQQGNVMRINPHPRDWRGSRRCNALLARNPRMCLRCHTEVQALDCSPN